MRMATSIQSICAVVRSTPTHCAGVPTVCEEGAQVTSFESLKFVCADGKLPSLQCVKVRVLKNT